MFKSLLTTFLVGHGDRDKPQTLLYTTL